MARQPRLDRPGCLHHVMARGNAGAAIFADDEDRQEFLRLLGDGVRRFGHTVHAFCLMGNHFHLAVRTGEVPLSRIMQNLMFRYTRHVNRRHRRVGHLFQGRFKSVLVDEQSYLLELVRYIHLNPVRAGLVQKPEGWAWSGHRVYLGRAKEPFLDTDWVLGVLGGKPATARRRYAAFVREGMGGGRRDEFHRGGARPGVLGDGAFLKRMHLERARPLRRAPDLHRIVQAVCEAEGIPPRKLGAAGGGHRASRARALVGVLAQEMGAATLTAVAARTGRDVSTLSRAVGNLRALSMRDPTVLKQISALKRGIRTLGDRDPNTQA